MSDGGKVSIITPREKKARIVTFFGFVLVVFSSFAMEEHPGFWPVAIIGATLWIAGILYRYCFIGSPGSEDQMTKPAQLRSRTAAWAYKVALATLAVLTVSGITMWWIVLARFLLSQCSRRFVHNTVQLSWIDCLHHTISSSFHRLGLLPVICLHAGRLAPTEQVFARILFR